ncbi:hypothetical protein THRCLA_20861 [Thraustotheca clavata]|uniref:Uncharacterized protein n=1 Tax=Thraustotheca clavata TaxID=74557 RepID=A0A1W0A2P7_9STRA|nr:hypothetical protein THRCLA_20861 [Thraustotheca clavata]
MDFELHCNSANVEIGSTSGVGYTLYIGLSFVVLCYAYERWKQPKLQHKAVRTSLLNASSYYVFELMPSTGQYLDKPSAVMAGIISFETNLHIHVFDTKSWRYIKIPKSPRENNFNRIPLSHL